VKQKDSGEKPIFGMLSGRELFYSLLSIAVIFALGLYLWTFETSGESQPTENPKFKNGREAAKCIHGRNGVPISDTKILYYDDRYQSNNAWRIYDAKSDEITDGSYLASALDSAGPYREEFSKKGWLTGWKGTLVLVTEKGTNHEQFICQWSTNDDKLQIFKPADFSGGQRFLSNLYPSRLSAVGNGWLYSFGFFNWKGPILVTGNQFGPMAFANPFPTNQVLGSSWPFQGGLYVTATDTNKSSMEVFVLSLTNQALVYSNTSVETPLPFDEFLAQPDPAGTHVIWVFAREPKIALKLRALVPASLRHGGDPGPTIYYYSSDIHATKFHFIYSIKNPDSYHFLWGVNGDSIWLPDTEKGIKKYPLK
jgi:hypothetical protein